MVTRICFGSSASFAALPTACEWVSESCAWAETSVNLDRVPMIHSWNLLPTDTTLAGANEFDQVQSMLGRDLCSNPLKRLFQLEP